MKKGLISVRRFERLVVILFRLIERQVEIDRDLAILERYINFSDKAILKSKKALFKINRRILKIAKKVIKNQALPKIVFATAMYLYTVQVEHNIQLFDSGTVEITKKPANGSWSYSVKTAVKSYDVSGGKCGWKLVYVCVVGGR